MANKEYDESVINDPNVGYFAAKPGKECVENLEQKTKEYYGALESVGFWDKLRNMYAAYHGACDNSIGDAHQINFVGEDGEYAEIKANHLRNIGRNTHTMVTSVRPAMQTRSMNTDHKSQIQTRLGNGLLDYYMRASGMGIEERLKLACEYSICLGSGYLKLGWNPNKGEVANQAQINSARSKSRQGLEKMQIPKREMTGDIDISIHSPFDIVEDLTREDIKHDWKCIRSSRNRFDLIKMRPDLADEIMKVPSKLELPNLSVLYDTEGSGGTDDIFVWEFYHERTECMEDGRYILYADASTILYDGPLPYRTIPIYDIKPGRILGTNLGYSDLFDVLPLQDAMDTLYSIILTNQSATGIQTILNPTNSNLEDYQLTKGLAILSYNPQGGKPEALQLTSTPQEVFTYLDFLIKTAETISGMNSVVRGNPEASLRSGSAIAMVQANAIQYVSNLQAEYIHLMEGIGLGILQILIDFADSPRIADIVGESGKSYIKTFKGEDLREINRVVVDSANPLSKTLAGKMNMATELIQYGEITPAQYVNVINTGNLETATDSTVSVQEMIKQENEAMMMGETVEIFYLENHPEHIMGHQGLIADPDMKKDPELLQLVGDHINKHIEVWRGTDPAVLMSIGIQPLPQMPQAPQQVQPQGQPPQTVESTAQEVPTNETPIDQAVEQVGASPENGPRMPEGFEDVPITPEENFEKIQGGM